MDEALESGDSNQSQPLEPTKTLTQWGLLSIFYLCGIGLVGLAIIAYAGKSHWAIDLLAQFRVQYSLLLIPMVGLSFLLRRFGFGLVLLAGLIVNCLPIYGYFLSPPATQSTNSSLRVLVFNVLSANTRFHDVVDFVNSEDPDLFLAMEVNEDWAEHMVAGLNQMPYRLTIPQHDNFGIAIFSKVKLDEVAKADYGPLPVPSIRAAFQIDGRDFSFIGTHPVPPLRSFRADARSQQLLSAANDLDSYSSRILVGDFNLTPWSPHFNDIRKAANLESASKGFGVQPTWYVFPTVLGGLKIDHVLISNDLNVENYRVGPDLGSDHRAVIVDLSW